MMTPRQFLVPAGLLLVLIASGILLPCIGQTFQTPGSEIYALRFHRTALALIAGAGLALAGLVFQAMFRNPLATPYTLGVASGAAFGAALCLQTTIRFGLPGLIGFIPTVSLGAFFGASLAMGIVLGLTRRRETSTEQMLLAGVAVNFFFASLIMLIQYLSNPHDTFQILRWTMGGVQNATFLSDWLGLLPIVLMLMLFLMLQSRTMNVFVTGSDRAKSLGVNVGRFRLLLFIVTSLVVGAIVSVTGPIGFVGLLIPHIARLLTGPDHRILIVSTAFLGATFLAVCDTAGRLLASPGEFPVGIITSLLGGPFFLWLLLKRK
ncbi:MAG: iron ABC transporter permease [Planctomycetaceae bacterium]|nr:iron ABC transporter permease [Planctomycetaceae bacterium]